MKYINLLLILVIAFIIYIIVTKLNTELFTNDNSIPIQKKDSKIKSKSTNNNITDILNGLEEKITDFIDFNFNETQFHTDYRDVIDSMNNIAPAQKQIFNLEYSPVTNSVLTTDDTKVLDLVNSFINSVNKSIKQDVASQLSSSSGWDELAPMPKVESGWDKQMKALGLHPSIYPEPAPKSHVKLLKIDRVEESRTENQTKYTCFIFLVKDNVDDQMVLRVSFVIDNSNLNLDRDLNKPVHENQTRVVIEEIFILGFMSKSMGPNELTSSVDKFYSFDNLNKDETDIIDQSTIMKQLMNKYKSRASEMRNLTSALDTEGNLDFSGLGVKKDAPHLSNYKGYQTTQTIFDDFTQPVNFQ